MKSVFSQQLKNLPLSRSGLRTTMDNGKWLQTNLDHLRDKLFLCVVKPEGTKPKHPHVILILKNRKKPKITTSLAMRIDHFTVEKY